MENFRKTNLKGEHFVMKYKRKSFAVLSISLVCALLFASISSIGYSNTEDVYDVREVEEYYQVEYLTEELQEEVIPIMETLNTMEIAPFCWGPMEPNTLYLPPEPVMIPVGHSIAEVQAQVILYDENANIIREAFILDSMITGFDKTEVGVQQVTINLWGLSDVFYVEVFEVTPDHSIAVTHRTPAIFVDGTIEDAGMYILIKEGETPVIWRSVNSDMVTGLDTSTTGVKEFTITFMGLTIPVSLNVISIDEIPAGARIVSGGAFVSAWPHPVVPVGGSIESAGIVLYVMDPLTTSIDHIIATFHVTDDMVTGFDNNRIGWQETTVHFNGMTKGLRIGVFDFGDIESGENHISITAAIRLAMDVTFVGGTRLSEVKPVFIIYSDGVETARGEFEWTGVATGTSTALLSGSFTGTVTQANEWCFISTLGELTWRVELPTGVRALEATSGTVVLTEPEEEDSPWFSVSLRLAPVESETEPTPQPNVQITKTASVSYVDIDGNIVFTMTVRNTGTDRATGVVVTSRLPDGLTYVSSSANATFNVNNRVLTEAIGNMEPGATSVVTTTVRATTAGIVEKTGTVSGTNIPNRSDSATVTVRPAGTPNPTPTSPQTGDDLTLTGLIASAIGSLLTLGFLLFVVLEKKRRRREELRLQAQITSMIM